MAKKLERPLVIGGNEAYPLTTADQIIMSDGSRLETSDGLLSKIADVIYPIGSIYMSVNSASPATLFGGTWERIKDTFLLSAGDTYSAGATGGEAAHTLNQSEIPNYLIGFIPTPVPVAHNQWTNGGIVSAAQDSSGKNVIGGTNSSGVQYGWDIYTNGGSQPHNNMPPYLAVYCWKRVS